MAKLCPDCTSCTNTVDLGFASKLPLQTNIYSKHLDLKLDLRILLTDRLIGEFQWVGGWVDEQSYGMSVFYVLTWQCTTHVAMALSLLVKQNLIFVYCFHRSVQASA